VDQSWCSQEGALSMSMKSPAAVCRYRVRTRFRLDFGSASTPSTASSACSRSFPLSGGGHGLQTCNERTDQSARSRIAWRKRQPPFQATAQPTKGSKGFSELDHSPLERYADSGAGSDAKVRAPVIRFLSCHGEYAFSPRKVQS